MTFAQEEWDHACRKLYAVTLRKFNRRDFDFELPSLDVDDRADAVELVEALAHFLRQCPKEVHSLTLAEAILRVGKTFEQQHLSPILNVLNACQE